MKLYVHNLEIRLKQAPVVRNKVAFKSIVKKWRNELLENEYSVLITDEKEFDVAQILKYLIDLKSPVFKRITFVVSNLQLFKSFMKAEFKDVPAAGGLVEKHDE